MSVKLAMSCAVLFFGLSGCATMPGWISSSGASRQQVQERRGTDRIEGIQLVDVNDSLARRLAEAKKLGRFDAIFSQSGIDTHLVGPGDVIEISVWETPPAMLFGAGLFNPMDGTMTSQAVTLPGQMVNFDGMITVPFAGRVPVKGRTTQEIESVIVKRLQGKANQPQVLVRVVKNNTSNVTLVGEVGKSALIPLTPKRERLLDALAEVGGVKHPVDRMAIQLSRESVTAVMPLDAVIRDPRQNIPLMPGDVVTALFQPQSFSVLGATGKNEEIPFEAQGISLAQALARSGGLIDNRADARGVFIFRFEDQKLIDPATPVVRNADGTIPVVYQVDLRDPASFFVTQNFPVQNRDVIYVSNSPAAEFEKFLRLVVSVAVPTLNINNSLQRLAQ
jgi:polysaccharide export outer membrane protein